MKHESPTRKYNQLINLNWGEEQSEQEQLTKFDENEKKKKNTSHYKDKVKSIQCENRAYS